MKINPIKLSIFISTLCIVSGCDLVAQVDKSFSKQDLIGTYEAKYSYATETLILREDGEYRQRIVFDTGKFMENQNSWDYDSHNNNVVLHKALVIDNYDKPLPISEIEDKGDWTVHVEKIFGKISLNFNQDLPIKLRKKD